MVSTRWLLRAGILAGPLYLAVGVIQGLVRDGFDFGRHPLSVLANGSFGWVQTANFLVTGLLVITAAAGFRRALGPNSRGVTWCLAGYGVAMIVAAAFPADPVDGFPPGTPEGFPTSISSTGLVHFAAGALAFSLLALSAFFAAWTMARQSLWSLAVLSLLSAVGVAGGFFGGLALPIGVVGIWFAVVAGWAWLSIMSMRLNPLA
jgi:hypothetical protein